jgi:hypothetical protein
MSYINDIQKIKNLTIYDIIQVSYIYLPDKYKQCAFAYKDSQGRSLEHGTAILETEEQCCAYMVAYGSMHHHKLMRALDESEFPYNALSNGIEIYDWGCGQGIGTLALIEKLRQHNLLENLHKVTLEEPSNVARARAILHVRKALKNKNVEIVDTPMYLPSYNDNNTHSITKIEVKQPCAIHIFSNILDIETISLKSVSKMITASGQKHIVLCIGPANLNESRIYSFKNYFIKNKVHTFTDFQDTNFGHHPDGKVYGCLINSFTYNFSTKNSKETMLIYKAFRKEDKNGEVFFTLYLHKKVEENKISVARYMTNIFNSIDTCAIYNTVSKIMGNEDEKTFKIPLEINGEIEFTDSQETNFGHHIDGKGYECLIKNFTYNHTLLIYKAFRKEDKYGNVFFTLYLRKKAEGNIISVARYMTNVFDSAETGVIYDTISEIMGNENEKTFEIPLEVNGEVEFSDSQDCLIRSLTYSLATKNLKKTLLIYKAFRKEDKYGNVFFTLHLRKKTKGNTLSVARYKTNIFDSTNTGALYDAIAEVMGKEEEMTFDEPFEVDGEVAKVAVPKHYYFSINEKGKVVIDKDRIVQFIRVVTLDEDTIENQRMSYLDRVPEEAWIEEDDEEEEEDD